MMWEAALLTSRSTYTPTVYEHIPGTANVIADTLSRIDAPDGKDEQQKQLPAILAGAKKIARYANGDGGGDTVLHGIQNCRANSWTFYA